MATLTPTSKTGPAVRVEDRLVIPAEVGDLASFRRWSLSETFPEMGRIDYVEDTIEVQMSPEDLQRHGVLKAELFSVIKRIVDEHDLGQVFVDRARLVAPAVGLSCEPDVLFVCWEALREGRTRYLPQSPERPGRFWEVEGAVELVVEVVSRRSVRKDTERLPPLYAGAGVQELWIADATGEKLSFQIQHLEGDGYVASAVDARGYLTSRVLSRRLRLAQKTGPLPDTWRFTVDEVPV